MLQTNMLGPGVQLENSDLHTRNLPANIGRTSRQALRGLILPLLNQWDLMTKDQLEEMSELKLNQYRKKWKKIAFRGKTKCEKEKDRKYLENVNSNI